MKRWFPRYYKKPPEILPNFPFTWDRAYKNRKMHLAKVVIMDAPEVIIEIACRNMLKAISRSHKARVPAFQWLRYEFIMWFETKIFRMRWYWCRFILGWSHEHCEKYFFEEYDKNPDPEVEELRKMSGLSEKSSNE